MTKMYKDDGFTYRFLVIVVIIVIAMAGVVMNKIIGKDGMVETATSVEINYNKEEVLDKINFIITQHFVKTNTQAKEENKILSEIYSADLVIEYLKQNSIIEDVYLEDGNIATDNYKINLNNLYEDYDKSFLNSGEYYVNKQEDSYVVIYKCDDNEDEIIGELQIQQV